MRKPVFRKSDKARLKSVSSATETSQKLVILLVASLYIILCIKRITKALIRLRGCAGWSAALLFVTPRRQLFSRRGPNKIFVRYKKYENQQTHPHILISSFVFRCLHACSPKLKECTQGQILILFLPRVGMGASTPN